MRHRLRETTGDSLALRQLLGRWLEKHPEVRTLSLFAALPGEPDLLALPELHPDRRWLFPRVDGDLLTFHQVTDPHRELLAGAFGIREPAAGTPVVPVGEIDAFLCPGLAFDARGGRLGRGRGFYDRMLAGARPDALKLGIGFAFQVVEDTCAEAHDVRMDEVLTQ